MSGRPAFAPCALAQVAQWSLALRAAGQTVVLANGAFDLLHVGHLRYLEAARALGDALVVAVNADASVRQSKGSTRPLVPERERAELVAALRCVDRVVIFADKTVAAVIAAVRPAIQAKGTDYTVDTVPESAQMLRLGGRVAIVGDAKNHSTTALAGRIRREPPANGRASPQPEGFLP